MDYALAADELGFAPAYEFEAGLAETLEWYRANGQWVQSIESGEYRSFMDTWYGERR